MEVTAVEPGEIFLHVVNNYDGYENNIVVSISSPMTAFAFTTNAIEIFMLFLFKHSTPALISRSAGCYLS